MSRRTRVLVVGLTLALIAPLGIVASGAAIDDQWAWAVVRKPTAKSYRITSRKDAKSSTGGPIRGIRRSGKPQRIGVRCYNGNGTQERDASFTLSYVK